MVETNLPGANLAVPATSPATAPQRKQYFNADGSAVPDVVAYHHRPEDIYDDSNQSVGDDTESSFFGKDGFSFGDLLDIINPLQHIPVVSTIYRAITGDEISPGARVAGGALFGGPIGLGVAVVNAAVEASAGEDIGDTILTAFVGDAPPTKQNDEQAQQVATAVTDSDPAILAAATAPVSLLPKKTGAAHRIPAAVPLQRSVISNPIAAQSKLAFGGIGTMPVKTPVDQTNDPVAAVLNARSAVPAAAGPVPGLGRAPLGRVERLSTAPLIGSRLSDKLSALAAETSTPKRPKNSDNSAVSDRKASSPPSESAPRPQIVPSNMVPQAMLNTLDRYRQMKKTEAGNLPG